MFIEIHLLQNLAPSNVNRDDNGSPKECQFGGYTRARFSSQSAKRAQRMAFQTYDWLDHRLVGTRTKRIVDALSTRLAVHHAAEDAKKVALSLIGSIFDFDKKEKESIEYLVLFSQLELDASVALCEQHWDILLSSQAQEKKGKKEIPAEIKNAFKRLLTGKGSADLALFGRMIANEPSAHVDGACQVAHAISTHELERQSDYFTAVDDLQPADKSGSAMIGAVEFNSATYYRYANVDTTALLENLSGDRELASITLGAFLRGMVTALPTGKQKSMAAQNPPSFVLMVARQRQLWSLANAFVKPIYPTTEQDLMTGSIAALDRYWGKLVKMYGDEDVVRPLVAMLDEVSLPHLGSAHIDSLEEMYTAMRAVAFESEH